MQNGEVSRSERPVGPGRCSSGSQATSLPCTHACRHDFCKCLPASPCLHCTFCYKHPRQLPDRAEPGDAAGAGVVNPSWVPPKPFRGVSAAGRRGALRTDAPKQEGSRCRPPAGQVPRTRTKSRCYLCHHAPLARHKPHKPQPLHLPQSSLH